MISFAASSGELLYVMKQGQNKRFLSLSERRLAIEFGSVGDIYQ